MTDKKFDYSGYYIMNTLVYKVFQGKDGSMRAQGYNPGKGFVDIENPWEILVDADRISEKEFLEHIKFEDSLFKKQQKSRE